MDLATWSSGEFVLNKNGLLKTARFFAKLFAMTHFFLWLVGGLLAYILGSIPFGFLIAKALGKDIRTLGSGNIGATNVFRSISKPLGLLTFTLDLLKGVCGIHLVPLLTTTLTGIAFESPYFPLFCGALTVAGHNWTCFLDFKGGKGVATSAGILIGLAPLGAGIAFAVWVVAFLTTRYVSVASMLAAITLAIIVWPLYVIEKGIWLPCAITCLAALSILKHRSNIARLRAGTESRFYFNKKPAKENGHPHNSAKIGTHI